MIFSQDKFYVFLHNICSLIFDHKRYFGAFFLNDFAFILVFGVFCRGKRVSLQSVDIKKDHIKFGCDLLKLVSSNLKNQYCILFIGLWGKTKIRLNRRITFWEAFFKLRFIFDRRDDDNIFTILPVCRCGNFIIVSQL